MIAAITVIMKIQAASAQVRENSVNLEIIPLKMDSWVGKDIPMTQDVYEILETDDVIFREYRDQSNYPVVVAIIFSDSKRASFHPPEICYIGGGIELMDKKFDTLALGNGSKLETTALSMKSETESGVYWITAWYWFMVGKRNIANYYVQQLSMLQSLFSSKPIQGAMIRISVDSNDEFGKEKASDFVTSLMPYLNKIHAPVPAQ